ncbi:hypothetical protein KPL74_09095 [Bacillus sp. NP157]|nr:hypothetical protein KPL74_09095 [Bacillus sp. NP157]
MMRSLCALLLLLALLVSSAAWCAPNPARTKGPPASATSLVARLYQAYAWEALSPADALTSNLFGPGLADQPVTELGKYFDPSLASAIAADADCVKKHEGEICNLDFDILFASQDPAASDMTIADGGQGKVLVTYTYPSNGQKVHLVYHTGNTSLGVRITDIVYRDMDNQSLRSLLGKKP